MRGYDRVEQKEFNAMGTGTLEEMRKRLTWGQEGEKGWLGEEGSG